MKKRHTQLGVSITVSQSDGNGITGMPKVYTWIKSNAPTGGVVTSGYAWTHDDIPKADKDEDNK